MLERPSRHLAQIPGQLNESDPVGVPFMHLARNAGEMAGWGRSAGLGLDS
ncbi:unannotated protein [freshwater metagenome]|uniref:Unannotated protein n=1 Tax=freshwater metagenome TaxID=449393 RepID=A0A6J7DAL1_9ZZZZ